MLAKIAISSTFPKIGTSFSLAKTFRQSHDLSMAYEAFLKIVGPEVQAGGGNSDIPILSFRFETGGPKETPNQGLNPGVKKGKIEFTKEWDESTPKLMLALTNNTRYREMIFSFFHTDKTHFTLNLPQHQFASKAGPSYFTPNPDRTYQ